MQEKIEKKGDIMTQLAILSDFMENLNLDATSKKISLDVASNDFDKVKTLIEDKTNTKTNIKNSFTIDIGEVSFVFYRT